MEFDNLKEVETKTFLTNLADLISQGEKDGFVATPIFTFKGRKIKVKVDFTRKEKEIVIRICDRGV